MQSSAASKKVPADALPLKVEAVVGQLREDLQQDITLRKKAEAAAQKAELALATLLVTVPSGLGTRCRTVTCGWADVRQPT